MTNLPAPAEILEIVSGVEVVSARLTDGAVHITYVARSDLLDRYGDETVTEAVRLALRVGGALIGRDEQ